MYLSSYITQMHYNLVFQEMIYLDVLYVTKFDCGQMTGLTLFVE